MNVISYSVIAVTVDADHYIPISDKCHSGRLRYLYSAIPAEILTLKHDVQIRILTAVYTRLVTVAREAYILQHYGSGETILYLECHI